MQRIDCHPHLRRHCFVVMLIAAFPILVAGCTENTSTDAKSNHWVPIGIDSLTGTQSDQHQRLISARDDLMDTLKERLMEVMRSEGPAEAVRVCSSEAGVLCQQIAEKHGVAIGRTSHKLRSLENRPPEWVEPFVTNRVEDPQLLSGPNGELAALYPIRVAAPCLTCHGPIDSLDEDVRSILAEQYPTDNALGFSKDDLRGWLWVNTVSRDRP